MHQPYSWYLHAIVWINPPVQRKEFFLGSCLPNKKMILAVAHIFAETIESFKKLASQAETLVFERKTQYDPDTYSIDSC